MYNLLKFIKRLSLFLLPVILLLSFPFTVMLLSGEFTPTTKVIKEQIEKTTCVVFDRAYSNVEKCFKLESTLYRRPDILVIGTSRTVGFRSKFVINSDAFYNAGRGIEQLEGIKHFLSSMPEGQEPILIIMGLDQWFFNPNWTETRKEDITEEKEKLLSCRNPPYLNILTNQWHKVYSDYFGGKFSLKDLFNGEKKKGKIGLSAIVNNHGYRNDGSRGPCKFIRSPVRSPIRSPLHPNNEDSRFKEIFQRMAQGTRRLEYGQVISSEALHELDFILKTSQARGIYVIGFLPPFPHEVYTKLKAMGDKYTYMWQIESAVGEIFDKYGFGFYNFSDLAAINASDSEAADDGFHAGEKVQLRLFIEMAKKDRVLARFVDIAYLQKRLELSDGVFYDEF